MYDEEVEILGEFIKKVYTERVRYPISYNAMAETNLYISKKCENFHLNFIHPVGSVMVRIEFKHIQSGRVGGMDIEMVEGEPTSRAVH